MSNQDFEIAMKGLGFTTREDSLFEKFVESGCEVKEVVFKVDLNENANKDQSSKKENK